MEIYTVTSDDSSYPARFGMLDKPPARLYVRGDITCLHDTRVVGIVGTRRCTQYGRHIAKYIAGDLARAGVTVVSGFARGIDTAAHTGAVEADGRTIAILGTGVDDATIYPAANRSLVTPICRAGGAIISEYAPGTPGSKYTFPDRNRLIASVSEGVVVIEARERSGALITARSAQSLNIPVFSCPGDVTRTTSRGPHKLLREGAFVTESAGDIIAALNINERNTDAGHGGPEMTVPHESVIIAELAEEPLHIDTLVERTGLPASEITAAVNILALQNKVHHIGNNTYTAQ